jgi:tRNA modification GTPase
MGMTVDDTIAAIATPVGSGGVAVIRVSGSEALAIAGRLFREPDLAEPDPPLADRPGKQFRYGWIVDPAAAPPAGWAGGATTPPSGNSPGGRPHTGKLLPPGRLAAVRPVDEVVMLVYRAPHSYTTEDVVEFQVHASLAGVQKILALCLAQGARLAAPGEFTKRAFLGGRIDLAQAEAIGDVTSAKTERSLQAAISQLEGHLSDITRRIREQVKHLLARLEASIDFPDEIDEISPGELSRTIGRIRGDLQDLLATAAHGKLLREGVSLAIVGRPNVGKSRLLNALLRADRAIVTEIPGTTRDVIEETLAIRGTCFRVLDTAGIRAETADPVEALGIARSRRALAMADLRLVVLDGSEPLTPADRVVLEAASAHPGLIVMNKIDRLEDPRQAIADLRPAAHGLPIVAVSAKTGQGLEDLEQALLELALGGEVATVAGVAINARHEAVLRAADSSLERAMETAAQAMPADFVAIDLRAAVASLGAITGEDLTEEVIDHIFANFCVGK